MTIHLVDVALWQGDLLADDVALTGNRAVNLKISHGLGQRSVHPAVAAWIAEARLLGLGIGTFHFLTGEASGLDQAAYAFGVMQGLGLAEGTAHQVDCESDATETILRDYVRTMTGLLGRPIVIYTGDWWWTARGRNWQAADLTPYLWAAPNAGYLAGYPGDDSPHWRAGYGGWPQLSVMQYNVGPLVRPDGTAGPIDVSKSAIRDPAVWTALTGGVDMPWTLVPALVSLRAEFNEIAPRRDKASDGTIGDPAHASSSSDHNPDETGNTPYEDSDNVNEVHALDIDATGPWPSGFSMEKAVQHIVARHKSGKDNRLQNVIFNRRIWSRSWGWTAQTYTGKNPHDKHAHFSCRYTAAQEADTRPWGLKELIEDMSFETDQVPISYPKTETYTGPTALGLAKSYSHESRDLLRAMKTQLDLAQKAILAAVAGVNEEGVLAAVREESAKISAQLAEQAATETARDAENLGRLLTALGMPPGGVVTVDALTAALRQVYGEAFDRASSGGS